MSLITQCPACNTMFRVVPDQLRVSDGWVRCGQCDEVFDANLHLQSETAAERGPEPQAPADSSPTEQDYDWGPELDGGVPDATEIAPLQEEPQDPFLHKSPHELTGAVFSIQSDAITDPVWDEGADLSRLAPELDRAANAAQPRYVQAAAPVDKVQEAAPLSFMRPAPVVRQRSALSAAAWWLFAMVLVCGLAIQMLRHERDVLASQLPASRPALDLLCSLTDCVVAPLRRIESLVIDSSSFVKVQTGIYRLNFTVKNNSSSAVALPSLELTLTDLQDQPVIRRVLSAAEVGTKQTELSGGAEWTASVPIALKAAAGTEKITGYRMLVFYP